LKSLYLRIWLTVVLSLVLFGVGSALLFQREVRIERGRLDAQLSERMGHREQERLAAWAELVENALPPATATAAEQARSVRDWSMRLRLPMALDDAAGQRLGASDSFARLADEKPLGLRRPVALKLEDGRVLWIARPPPQARAAMDAGLPPVPPGARGAGLAALLLVLLAAVAAGAYPVVRRLTRRLEALKAGVEQFGRGALDHRVDASGRDEVAAVAASFNQAADRVAALLASHKSLLANASHELRSPLARLKMAVSLFEDADTLPAHRARLSQEIRTNIAELDTLVDEVLLASRLDAQAALFQPVPLDVVPLAAEEAARCGVELQTEAPALNIHGDERLLRRALRNLLENARRYGGDGGEGVLLSASTQDGGVALRVCDRGPGVPEALRERIFEPFFRLPGHAEHAGGVGLGLALVRQIAERHDGWVRCEAGVGGVGSCFVLWVPAVGAHKAMPTGG
jgi:signal transduction histidine kinase